MVDSGCETSHTHEKRQKQFTPTHVPIPVKEVVLHKRVVGPFTTFVEDGINVTYTEQYENRDSNGKNER